MITYQKFVDAKFRKYFINDSPSFTENLKVIDTIKEHNGCVNTIEWDKTGTRILSGGDDATLRIHQYMCDHDKPWVKNSVFRINLPTSRNILSAKFMPIYNEKIVSASKCGSIFVVDVNQTVDTDVLVHFKHAGPALNISTIPHDPHNFLSASNDKTVCIFDIREGTSKPSHQMLFPCSLAAVAVHPMNTNMFATGGSDSFVRVFDRRFFHTNSTDVETTLKSVIEICRPLEFPLDANKSSGTVRGYGRRYVNSVTYEPNLGRYMLVNYMYDSIYMFDTKVQEDNALHVDPVEEQINPTGKLHIQYNWDNTGPQRSGASQNLELECPPSIQSFINELHEKELGLNDDTISSNSVLESQLDSVKRYKQVWKYDGHLNCRTMIKDSRFWGHRYILSGSECGNILVWERRSTLPVAAIETDAHVTNRIEPHPFLPIIASCGIDHNIKIVSSDFEPDNDLPIKPKARLNMILQQNQIRADKAKKSQGISMMDLLRIMRAQRMIRRVNSGASSADQ